MLRRMPERAPSAACSHLSHRFVSVIGAERFLSKLWNGWRML